MPMPRRLARFNRRVTNRVARRFAGRVPGMVVIEHRGRRSGRAYRTPVNAFRVPGGYAVALTYTSASDWVQNVLAAGGADVVHRGQRVRLGEPEVLRGHDARALLPTPVRAALRILRADEVLRLREPSN
jgi:deazaflavin-dependent oxidoreductase (nitroreductase family)